MNLKFVSMHMIKNDKLFIALYLFINSFSCLGHSSDVKDKTIINNSFKDSDNKVSISKEYKKNKLSIPIYLEHDTTISFDSFKHLISTPKPTPIENLLNKYSLDKNYYQNYYIEFNSKYKKPKSIIIEDLELRIKQGGYDKVINLPPQPTRKRLFDKVINLRPQPIHSENCAKNPKKCAQQYIYEIPIYSTN